MLLQKGFQAGPKSEATLRTNGRRLDAAQQRLQMETEQRARRYVRYAPLDLRFWFWVASWVYDQREREQLSSWPRWRRFRYWLYLSWPEFRSFLVAFFGPRIDGVALAERERICDRCPWLRIRLPKWPTGKFRRYCASCHCPDWPISELARKNRMLWHRCPQRRHPNPRDEWITTWIEQRETEITKELAAQADKELNSNGSSNGNDLAE